MHEVLYAVLYAAQLHTSKMCDDQRHRQAFCILDIVDSVRKAGRVDDASRFESGQTLNGSRRFANPSPSAILKREGNITLIIEASQHHPAKIIPFPISTICPTCHRPCSDNELSGCMTCGAKYCKHDKWTCECDTESKLFSILPHFIQDALS